MVVYVMLAQLPKSIRGSIVHRMAVIESFDVFPSKASLRMTGYFPGLLKSIEPEATAAAMMCIEECYVEMLGIIERRGMCRMLLREDEGQEMRSR